MEKKNEDIQKHINDLVKLKKECQMKINEYDKIIKRLYAEMKKSK